MQPRPNEEETMPTIPTHSHNLKPSRNVNFSSATTQPMLIPNGHDHQEFAKTLPLKPQTPPSSRPISIPTAPAAISIHDGLSGQEVVKKNGPRGWKVVFLGTSQGTGIPRILCRCHICKAAKLDSRLRRTASSVAIVVGRRCFLLDASPDIGQQLLSLGSCDLAGVFLTGHSEDHLSGLLRLAKECPDPDRPLPIFCSEHSALSLRMNESYRPIAESSSFAIKHSEVAIKLGDLTFTSLPMTNAKDSQSPKSFAILVSDGDTQFLYIPSFQGDLSPQVSEAVSHLKVEDMIAIDGSFYMAGEIQSSLESSSRHSLISDSLANPAFQSLIDRGTRVVFTHLHHANPVAWPGSKEYQSVLRHGFEIASDGMEWEYASDHSPGSGWENVYGGGI